MTILQTLFFIAFLFSWIHQKIALILVIFCIKIFISPHFFINSPNPKKHNGIRRLLKALLVRSQGLRIYIDPFFSRRPTRFSPCLFLYPSFSSNHHPTFPVRAYCFLSPSFISCSPLFSSLQILYSFSSLLQKHLSLHQPSGQVPITLIRINAKKWLPNNSLFDFVCVSPSWWAHMIRWCSLHNDKRKINT